MGSITLIMDVCQGIRGATNEHTVCAARFWMYSIHPYMQQSVPLRLIHMMSFYAHAVIQHNIHILPSIPHTKVDVRGIYKVIPIGARQHSQKR